MEAMAQRAMLVLEPQKGPELPSWPRHGTS